jgi:hypothetical protein
MTFRGSICHEAYDNSGLLSILNSIQRSKSVACHLLVIVKVLDVNEVKPNINHLRDRSKITSHNLFAKVL